MSSEYAIEVSNLSKCYQIYDKPSDRLRQILFCGRRQYYKEFWALSDVSFKVKKGETVGIIGRNGSGKSTLLQMICGTLNPTIGNVTVNGRVAALLELGAGFNPEFTGVENIYMAASLYGLTREDVDQRFEAIAGFADIGDHINQPVKTYSSGMYVRLAFAVIANVDADILVIDEALAVGDAIFTQKCMRFIRKFKEHGTLLFVSHDMGSVLGLCETALWLNGGHINLIGAAQEVAESYLQYTLQQTYGTETQLSELTRDAEVLEVNREMADNLDLSSHESQYKVINNLSEANGWKTSAGEIVSAALEAQGLIADLSNNLFQGGETVSMRIEASIHESMTNPIIGFLVRDRLGQDLFGENTLPYTDRNPIVAMAGSILKAEFQFVLPLLPNGDYSVMISLADGSLHSHIQHHWLHDALIFHVSSSKARYGLVGIPFKAVRLGTQ